MRARREEDRSSKEGRRLVVIKGEKAGPRRCSNAPLGAVGDSVGLPKPLLAVAEPPGPPSSSC